MPTPTTVTPAQVKALSLAGLFNAIADATVQLFIDRASDLLGSAYARSHSMREPGVALLAAHLLYIRLKAEGLLGGGGGGGGGGLAVLSSVTLTGVGSKGYAVQAQAVADLNDVWKIVSPWSAEMHSILDAFGPSIFVTGMVDG